MTKPAQRPRLFYAAGPGDVIGTYHLWRAGREDSAEPTVAYSAQFYDLCRELDASGLVITACPRRDRLRDGAFTLEQAPFRWRLAGGWRYHAGQLFNGLRLTWRALRFRADVAFIAEGSHWFVWGLLAAGGVRVVPLLHNVLGMRHARRGLVRRALTALNRRFFRRSCFAILTASDRLSDEVRQLTGESHPPLLEFLPLYPPETFAGLPQPDPAARPFRVLYVGRIEDYKGVFDLLAIARQLRAAGRRDVEFDLCGDGSAATRLAAEAAAAGFSDSFRLHGQCDRPRLRTHLAAAHVVIVPTRAHIGEGFNQVVVEAVLAGRPVIASSACPANRYVAGAVLEVAADDLDGYLAAVLQLADDRQRYVELCRACGQRQGQFFDRELSFGAALRRTVRAALDGHRPAGFRVPQAGAQSPA